MKTLVMSVHSKDYDEMARTTAMNKWEYSCRHGYDLLTARMPYDELRVGAHLLLLRDQLLKYDTVLLMGSDVVITNMATTVESLTKPRDSVVIAREELRPHINHLNSDVMIWNRTCDSLLMIDRIYGEKELWLRHPWVWQQWMVEYSARDPRILKLLRVVDARVMNSMPHEGPAKWQPGDFVCHFVDYDLNGKIEMAKQFLQLVQ